MKYDSDIWPVVKDHPWKWQAGRVDIVGAIVHATRSGIAGRPAWLEYTSAVNWMLSPHNFVDTNGVPASKGGDPNRKWYGGMSHLIIGGGQVCRVIPDEFVPRFSAGVHDFRAVSIEMAQGVNGEAFDPRDIELLREVLDELSGQYGFPLRRIAFVDGWNNGWPGIVGHEDTAQGRGQGKSDPGARLWEQLTLEDEMTPEEKARLARLEAIVAGNGLNVDVSEGNVGTLKEIGLQAPIVGTTIQLTGERALEFARLRGFSFALGLKLAIDRVAALEVGRTPGTPAPGEEIIITIGGERYRLVAEKETA